MIAAPAPRSTEAPYTTIVEVWRSWQQYKMYKEEPTIRQDLGNNNLIIVFKTNIA